MGRALASVLFLAHPLFPFLTRNTPSEHLPRVAAALYVPCSLHQVAHKAGKDTPGCFSWRNRVEWRAFESSMEMVLPTGVL